MVTTAERTGDGKPINNKDTLYSTGNYIQYLRITYNEKNQEKNGYYIYVCVCVCVYVTELLC